MFRRSFRVGLIAVVAVSWSCSGAQVDDIPTGTEVTIETLDGSTVRGRIADVESGAVTVEQGDGSPRRVRRADIRDVAIEREEVAIENEVAIEAEEDESDNSSSAGGELASTEPELVSTEPEIEYEDVTVPAGTTLALVLESTLASDVSHVEDLVRAHLDQAVVVRGQEVIPEGSSVLGLVTVAEPSGNVKGRARRVP